MSNISSQDYQTYKIAYRAINTPSKLEKACVTVLPILLGLIATLPMMYIHYYGSK